MSEDIEKPPIYAVRLSPRAERDLDAITVSYAESIAGERNAVAWRDGFYDEIATLATLPHRYPAPPDASAFSFETKQLLYRRAKSSVTHRIYYRIFEDGDDGRLVRVIHIRYASARALTRREAREIEAQQ